MYVCMHVCIYIYLSLSLSLCTELRTCLVSAGVAAAMATDSKRVHEARQSCVRLGKLIELQKGASNTSLSQRVVK